MAESIPVSPGGLPPQDGAEDILDSKEGGASIDDDILADIERSLDDDASFSSGSLGEKVELDKADLPLIWDDDEEEEEPEPEASPEIEVDLADAGETQELDLGEEPEQKGPKLWLMLGAGIVAALLLALGVSWYMGAFDEPTPEPLALEEMPPYMFQGKVPDPVDGLRYELKPFTVPLQRSKKGRILTIVVSLEVAEPDMKGKLMDRERLLRDVVYRMMRDRAADELDAARSQRLLNAQVKTEINSAMGSNVVYKVYFTEFVITG